jgi:hypothetical protein
MLRGMKDDLPTMPARRRWWRVLGWGMLVAVVATFGWSGWRTYDYRAAVREARAAGFVFAESPTPLAAIRADWRAGLRLATWTERERMLELRKGTDLAPLRPLLLRLDPTHLWAWDCRHVDALAGLTRLQVLDVRGSDVNDLAPLAGLAQLQELHLDGCTGIADLAPLAGLAQLWYLRLNGCPGVADIAPLAGLGQLLGLDLSGCTSVTDLAPLAGVAKLLKLNLHGCTGLDSEAVAAFKKSRPQVRVTGLDGRPVNAE